MSKYEPLKEHFHELTPQVWRASFKEIEEILGFRLPASARRHEAWWANGGHSHSSAWCDAGWRTSEINLDGEKVTFNRDGQKARSRESASIKVPEKIPALVDFEDAIQPLQPTLEPVTKAGAVALISCSKQKAKHAARAKDLYTSSLFRKSRAYVENIGYPWLVLSALHGVVEPNQIIEPYDKTLLEMRKPERKAWAEKVFKEVCRRVSHTTTITLLAGKRYAEFLVPMLEEAGYRVDQPLKGLRLGERLSKLNQPSGDAPNQVRSFYRVDQPLKGLRLGKRPSKLSQPSRHTLNQVRSFYELIDGLREAFDGGRLMADCSGRMEWPKQGVYFFMEPGEMRASPFHGPRIIRVGTHALHERVKTTLWTRLRNHRGTQMGTGKHRGSVFREHVGGALLERYPDRFDAATWYANDAPKKASDKENEAKLERAVSEFIAAMRVLWIDVPDLLTGGSDRGRIERNAIGLLSKRNEQCSSEKWLGNWCPHEKVRASGLWNADHINAPVENHFLNMFGRYVEKTIKAKRRQ